MKFEEMKVYIAAPFFNGQQLSVVRSIEMTLDTLGIEYFSPRSNGVIKSDKKIDLRKIYTGNIYGMIQSNFMIAVIDDSDTGTIWEMGYYTALMQVGMEASERKLITVSNKNHGLNVMLKFGSSCHLKSITSMINLLEEIKGYDSMELSFGSLDEGASVAT